MANIDGRGTGFQGDTFKHSVYGQLGRYETEDTIQVIRHLVKNHKFIDSERVCVWGWSYGGYVTGRILAAIGRVGGGIFGKSFSSVYTLKRI